MSSLFFPIATLFLSIAVVLIALQPWQVAHDKLRLDLFDRRYKVFDATRRFLALIIRDANFENSQLVEFNAGTCDGSFFFRADVVDYLSQIRQRALDMRTHRKRLDGGRLENDEHSRLAQAENEELKRLNDQLTAMTNVFAPTLIFAC
jgi:hypothetical protein